MSEENNLQENLLGTKEEQKPTNTSEQDLEAGTALETTENVESQEESEEDDYTTIVNLRQEVIKKLEECAENDELDVFIYTAFVKPLHHHSELGLTWEYWWATFRAGVCMFVQYFGTVVLLQQSFSKHSGGWKFCKKDGGKTMNVATTSFLLYFFFCMRATLRSIDKYSLYGCRSNTEGFLSLPPKLVNREWVVVGYISNYLLCYCVIIASFVIIYETETMLDLFLNGVALFFVLDMDDMIMNDSDKQQVSDTMKNVREKLKTVVPLDDVSDLEPLKTQNENDDDCDCRSGCRLIAQWCLVGIPELALYPLAFLVIIWNAICY